MSVIGHGRAGGISRKTYSKNGTGLEEMRDSFELWRDRDGERQEDFGSEKMMGRSTKPSMVESGGEGAGRRA